MGPEMGEPAIVGASPADRVVPAGIGLNLRFIREMQDVVVID